MMEVVYETIQQGNEPKGVYLLLASSLTALSRRIKEI